MDRRKVIQSLGFLSGLAIAPQAVLAQPKPAPARFRFCLNTSTIRGQQPGLKKYIEIAARAGYDSVELWVPEVKSYRDGGNSMAALKKLLDDSNISVENAIGFAPWMIEDEQQRAAGLSQLREEMLLMGELGCRRIAAPPAGVSADASPDLFAVGDRYRAILDLGRKTGVMPQLEFWGGHPVFYHMAQAMMAVVASGDADARILPDIYHLFRGGSGFECLKMVNGTMIEIFHVNDFPSSVPREQQNDSHRVYPGDGAAPLKPIVTDLSLMGGTKVLSLELFNPDYWKQEPLAVAKTGLEKMKKMAGMAS